MSWYNAREAELETLEWLNPRLVNAVRPVTLIQRLGWALMGYPAMVIYGRGNWVVEIDIPGWLHIYRLGARLANWNGKLFAADE